MVRKLRSFLEGLFSGALAVSFREGSISMIAYPLFSTTIDNINPSGVLLTLQSKETCVLERILTIAKEETSLQENRRQLHICSGACYDGAMVASLLVNSFRKSFGTKIIQASTMLISLAP